MPSLPKAGAQLELDTSAWDSAYKGAMADAAKLDATINDLGGTVDLKVTVTDSELVNAAGLVDNLNATATTRVSVDEAELDEAIDLLNDIKNLSIIDVVLNLTDASLNVLSTLEGLPGLGQLISNDNANAILSVGSGVANPKELAIAQDLFANNMVESVEAGALLINQLKSLGVEGPAALEEAANSAVNAQQAFLAVGQEADANQIILAQNQLVITGLADSYTEASDIIAKGIDAGLNTGDDFLDTITEYSNNFANAGASAEEFLSILNTGLESGFGNTDRVADLFRETTLRGLNPDETAAQDALKAIGLENETAAMQAGETTAVAWFQSVIDTIKAEENSGKQQTFAADIFGTQAEDQTVMGALGIDTVDATFDTIEGRAAEVATLLNSTVGNAFTELFNTINLEAAELLSDDTLNLDQKLQDIKTAIQVTVDELQSGKSLGEAIEVGFKIEGVDEFIGNFERIVGNLTIAFLEVVANIQDIAGKDSSSTRGEIARLAEGQLAFDLQLANADEVSGIISQAINRGVSLEETWAGLETAANEALSGGNFEGALNILEGFTQHATKNGASAETIAGFTDQFTSQLQTAFDTSIASGDFDVAKKISDAQGDPTAYTDALKGKFGFDAAAFDQMAADFATGMETAIIAENPTPAQWFEGFKPTEEVTTAISDFDGDVTEAVNNAALMTGLASQEMINAFSAITDGVTTADEEIAMAITGNTMTASFEAMSASADQNVEATKASFKGLLATVSQVDVAMSAFFNGIMAKVSAVNSAIEGIGTVPTTGGGGGNNTTNNINVNQTNNVQGNAQNVQTGYAIAEAIRTV